MRRLTLAATTLVLLACAVPAHAAPRDDNEQQPPRCLSEADARLTPSGKNFDLFSRKGGLRRFHRVKLSWEVKVPRGCGSGSVDLYLFHHCTRRRLSSLKGDVTLTVLASSDYSLVGRKRNAERTLARTNVKVRIPNPLLVHEDFMGPTLVQALGQNGQTIRLADDVDVNVTCERVRVGDNVTLLGGRTPTKPGPRIYTLGHPKGLLKIQTQNVRISGLRIEGSEKGVYQPVNRPDHESDGIEIDSGTNVEISNNELFGWMGSAIEVRDGHEQIPFYAPYQVRVHDNFIHHNRHYGRLGYGVAVGDGSYAEIFQNVFDFNRHAIAGDGSDWSGYQAYDNLVLENGGEHRPGVPLLETTHQFDMHGQRSCVPTTQIAFDDKTWFNCGRAGHSAGIHHNAFRFTKDNAVKLRGTPQLQPAGMLVSQNVFLHGSADEALFQTESGLREEFNQYGVDPLGSVLRCDYDGDGSVDAFAATGVNWWYSSGGVRHWVFIKRSTEKPTTCPPRQ